MVAFIQWLLFAGLTILLALAYLAPGALVLAAAGERRWHRFSLAAPLTVTITFLAAVGCAHWQIKYGIWPVLLVTVVLALVASPLRLLQRPHPGTRKPRTSGDRNPATARQVSSSARLGRGRAPSTRWLVTAALVVAALTWLRIAINIGHPWAPSQTYDAVYHLNVLAMIRDSGIATPWQMDISFYPEPEGFYPNGWHQVTALALPLVSDIPTLANASALAIVTLLWPLSLASLVWVASKGNRVWLLAALLLSQALPQFPQLFFSYGSLYPNLLGFAFLPALFAYAYEIVWTRQWRTALALVILALLAAPGVAMAHPATVLAMAILVPAIIATRLASFGQRTANPSAREIALRFAFALFGCLLLVAVVYAGAAQVPRLAAMQVADPAGNYPSSATFVKAIVKAVTLAAGTWFTHSYVLSWILGALVILGAFVALRQPHRQALVLMHLLAVLLFLSVDGDWNLDRRAFLTGFFYCDPMRMAGLLAITALPLLALGTVQVVGAVSSVIEAWRGGDAAIHLTRDGACASKQLQPLAKLSRPLLQTSAWSRKLGAGIVAVALVSQFMPGFFYLSKYTRDAFELPASQAGRTGMLTADEYQLLKRVDQRVPKTDTILGNPWTGTAFVWALAGRQPVFPDLASDGGGIYGWRLGKAANQIMAHPTGCEAVRERRAYWVLDFGHHYLWNGEDPSKRYQFFAGLEGLEQAGYAKVVDQQGEAKLLRITYCDNPEKDKS